MDKFYFETNSVEDILKDRIKRIDTQRDELEQEYYRAKLSASVKWETETNILLKEKGYLKAWLNSLGKQNPTEIK